MPICTSDSIDFEIESEKESYIEGEKDKKITSEEAYDYFLGLKKSSKNFNFLYKIEWSS